jgi:signal transduction histidine kinase
VEDHKGRLVAIEGVIRDVTEQRRQEERERLLAKAGELLGTVLDDRLTLRRLAELVVPPLADWCSVEAIEPNGHTIGLGGSHVDPAKTPLIDILQTQYPPERDGILARSRVLTTGQAVLMETMSDDLLQANSLDREGLLLWQQLGCSSLMAVPLRARGHMLGLLTLCVAGSERKYWRDDLALAEELANRAALAIDNARLLREAQEAIRVRDEFLSVAAHELKTPTTSLRGFAQLLARRVQTNTPLDVTQVRRMVETIDRQSGRLTRLITQLLEVSRIQGGRLNLDRAPTDLAQLARHVVQEMETAAASHTFVLEIADPLVADLDPLRLEHVLINLLDNAVKYSARGSTVTVFAGKAEPGKAVLHITDEGPGIDPEHRERIFQRFFQTRTGHAGGIGLGLYVSRQIVELHGGTLELESPPQGGSRFVVTLPMLPEATDQ